MKKVFRRGMSDEATREIAGLVGALLFGAAALMELVRMLTLETPWPGFTASADWVFGGLAIALWVGSAWVLARRSRKHRLLAFVGAFALFVYGALGALARSRFDVVYIVFGLVMPIIERLAFGGKLSIGHRVSEPVRPPSGREIL